MNQPTNPMSGVSPVDSPPPPMPITLDQPGVDTAVEAIDAFAPHNLERTVMQRLQAHPSLRFSRLSVHQCSHDSVCVEGFLESNEDNIDLCEVVRGIHGINSIVNRVMTAHPAASIPKKG